MYGSLILCYKYSRYTCDDLQSLLFGYKTAFNILSYKRNAQIRKLNHKFSSTVKVFMNIDVRYTIKRLNRQ